MYLHRDCDSELIFFFHLSRPRYYFCVRFTNTLVVDTTPLFSVWRKKKEKCILFNIKCFLPFRPYIKSIVIITFLQKLHYWLVRWTPKTTLSGFRNKNCIAFTVLQFVRRSLIWIFCNAISLLSLGRREREEEIIVFSYVTYRMLEHFWCDALNFVFVIILRLWF